MIENKDVFLLVLAFSVFWFTAFLCWFIWQLISMLRKFNSILEEAKEALSRVEKSLTTLVENFERSAPSVHLLLEGGKKLLEYLGKKKKKKVKSEE